MNEKIRKLKMMETVEALFSDGFSDVFGDIGKMIGLVDDSDFDQVMTYLEITMKQALDAAAEGIYENIGKGEAMVLWETSDHIFVMLNLGSHVTFRKYRIDSLESEAAVPANELADLRNLITGMREDLNKLLKAQPEKAQLLDDMEVAELDTPEDVESLDEPRIHGH